MFYVPIPLFVPFVTFIFPQAKRSGKGDHCAVLGYVQMRTWSKIQTRTLRFTPCILQISFKWMWSLQKIRRTELVSARSPFGRIIRVLEHEGRVQETVWSSQIYSVVISDPNSWWVRDHAQSTACPFQGSVGMQSKLLHVRSSLKETTLSGEHHLLWICG